MCQGIRAIKVKNSTETISPTKIICLGRNYRKHAEELGNVVPEKPIIFLKPPSSLIVEGEKILLPSQSQDVQHEVELGVVIGKAGRYIPRAEAVGHILGYCIFLDITARDIQKEETKRGAPWALAKGFLHLPRCRRLLEKRSLPIRKTLP